MTNFEGLSHLTKTKLVLVKCEAVKIWHHRACNLFDQKAE